jgi:hypothetical protein
VLLFIFAVYDGSIKQFVYGSNILLSISGWCGSHLTLELFYFAGRLPFPSIRQNWHKLSPKGKRGNRANEGDEDGMGALCST